MTKMITDSSLARTGIDPTEAQALRQAIDRLPPQWPDTATPLSPSVRGILDRFLGQRLSGPLRSLRLHDGPAALLIDGLPLLDELGPAPIDGKPTNDRLLMSKAVIRWLAGAMGVFLVGYPNIANGCFFHDVNPVRGTARPLSSKGGALRLPYHSDSAANEDRPDYLLLWGLRDAPGTDVRTGYSAVADALNLLDRRTRELLAKPLYRIQVPTIVDVSNGDEVLSPPVALVTGPSNAPEIRLHASRTQCLDQAANRAMLSLVGALDQVRTEFQLTPGRILIINNRRGVHCRSSFVPTEGPADRWLLRSYLLIDPWAHRRAISAERAHVLVEPVEEPGSVFCTDGARD